MRRLVALLLVGLLLLWPLTSAAAQEPVPTPEIPQVHIVRPGENLFRIALRYGTTVEAIQAANGLADPSLISVGQSLIIPVNGANSPTSAVEQVRFGDSLMAIAARHGLDTSSLAAANTILNPRLVYAGQYLTIPDPDYPAIGTQLLAAYPTPGETLLRFAIQSEQNLIALMFINDLPSPVAPLSGCPLGILTPLDGQDISPTLLPLPWLAVSLHPLPLEQGHTGGLHVETTIPGTLRVTFLGGDFYVASTPDGTQHDTLIGLHRYTAPGLYPLALTFESQDGTLVQYSQNVFVAPGDYTTETINLPPGVSELLDPELVRQEYLYVSELMSGYTPERYWDGFFLLPTVDDVTSGFGTIRSYNGEPPSSFHAGVDFGVPAGTPIYAPANGVVVDARQLDVRGYVVILDHGLGVYTGYWHLSAVLVEPGELVTAEQQIGEVGSTGLSTAAHLHWEMWVAGVQVDPLQWVRESFP